MDKIVDKRIKKLEAVESEEISEDGASGKEKKKLFNKAFSKLSKSKEKESITNEEKKEKILKEQRIATIVLEVVYILLQLYLVISLAISSFAYNLKVISMQEYSYTFGNVGVLVVLAVCLFVYRSFMQQKKNAQRFDNYRDCRISRCRSHPVPYNKRLQASF
jgi:uncharacterized membrane protein